MTNQPGRIAFRVEGDWWVAYFARAESMEGAHEIGRIRMNVVQDRERKSIFMDLVRHFVGEALEDIAGQKVDFKDPVNAPEHERSGRA